LSRLATLYRRRLLREFGTFSPSLDARKGSGYGRASTPSGVGGEYSARDDFPYTEGPTELDDEVEESDPWADENDEDVFLKKTGHRSFRNSGNHADRGSFAHTSNRGLGESSSMVPIPGLYRTSDDPGETGRHHQSAFRTGPGHKGGSSGSKAGWFGAPPPMMSDTTPPVYSLSDLPDSAERALQKAQDDHSSLVSDFEDEFVTGDESVEFSSDETDLVW